MISTKRSRPQIDGERSIPGRTGYCGKHVCTDNTVAIARGLGADMEVTPNWPANKIVKEQMVQTTSKKIVRSSEKQKPHACVPHAHYVRIGGLMRATASYGLL